MPTGKSTTFFEREREVGRFAEAEYVFQVLYPNKSKKGGFDWEWQSKMNWWSKSPVVGILAKLVSNRSGVFGYPYNEQGKDTSYDTWAPILRAKFKQNKELMNHLMSTGNKYLWEFVRGAQRTEEQSNEETWGCLIKSMVVRDGVLEKNIDKNTGKHKTYNSTEKNTFPKIYGKNTMGLHIMRVRREFNKALPLVPNTKQKSEEYICVHKDHKFGSGMIDKKLSNFYTTDVTLEHKGTTYTFPSSEHAYQAFRKDLRDNKSDWAVKSLTNLKQEEQRRGEKRKSNGASSSGTQPKRLRNVNLIWQYAYGSKITTQTKAAWQKSLRDKNNWKIVQKGNEKLVQFRKDAETDWKDWFVIKKSNIENAGEGLFAAREFPAPKTKTSKFSTNTSVPFTVAYYQGREFNKEPKEKDYVIKIIKRNQSLWVDGKENFNGTGKINDTRGKLGLGGYNVEFKGNGAITVTKNIKEGDELYVNYGTEYWENRIVETKGSMPSQSTVDDDETETDTESDDDSDVDMGIGKGTKTDPIDLTLNYHLKKLKF